MSTLFIKYTPDVETADPGFDENLQTVIAKTERYIAQSVTKAPATLSVTRMPRATGWSGARSRYSINFRPSTRRASTPHPEGMTR
jgi:hypothetical protein